MKYDWVVDQANEVEKMNVTLASGDLPDILNVRDTQLQRLVEAGQVADLTDAYNKYASDQLKTFLSAGDGVALKTVTNDGKMVAIPNFTGTLDSAHMVWIRQDWMKKLNLQQPKTMDDLIAIAQAFVNNDPDGDGKKDTYGLVLTKALNTDSMFQPTGFFNGYHAYIDSWVQDASGNYAYSTIQPEVKTVLAKLQELYKTGIIDPEFGTKDATKTGETVNSGKAGMFFGPMFAPFPVGDSVKNDKNADWIPYPIPSIDGKPAVVQTSVSISNYYAVHAGYEHPEALIKMLNYQIEKMYGENAATERRKFTGESDQGWHLATVSLLPPDKNLNFQIQIKAALDANDPSSLDVEGKGYYDGIMKYRDGDRSAWWQERIFGPESSQNVIKYYKDNNLTYVNPFVYAPTKSMTSYKSTLEKLQLETFTKIIYGAAPIDEFDKFVASWKKLGGDKITTEVNEILKK